MGAGQSLLVSADSRALQALMPRKHLSSQAGPDATALQRLNALASLNARLRQGQASVSLARKLHLAADDLELDEGEELDAQHARISLASGTAIVPWTCETGGADPAGVLVTSRRADGTLWTRPQSAAGSILQCAVGLCAKSTHCARLTLQAPPEEDMSEDHLFVARGFSVHRRCWKQEVLLHQGPSAEHDSVGESLRLSRAASLCWRLPWGEWEAASRCWCSTSSTRLLAAA